MGAPRISMNLAFPDEQGAMLTVQPIGLFNFVQKQLVRLDFTPERPQGERGVAGMWWGGESQAGWGISVMEQQGNLFVTWFTYDALGNPTWFAMPEGRWLDASTWTGPIYRTSSSGWLGGYDAGALRLEAVGDFVLGFAGPDSATFEWRIGGLGQRMPLERFPF
jgi:hypothetical protein